MDARTGVRRAHQHPRPRGRPARRGGARRGRGRLQGRTGPSLRRLTDRRGVRRRGSPGAERARCGAGRSPSSSCPPTTCGQGRSARSSTSRPTPLDVTATIVDLAVRGYLRIEEIPKEEWFGQGRLAAREAAGRRGDGSCDYERTPVRRPVRHRRRRAAVVAQEPLRHQPQAGPERALRRRRVRGMVHPPARHDAQRLARRRARAPCSPRSASPPCWRGRPRSASSASRSWSPRSCCSSDRSGCPGARPRATASLQRTLGFKRFIDESEKDRAQFAERQNLFTEYLPYAIVFGATERWARTFAGHRRPAARPVRLVRRARPCST